MLSAGQQAALKSRYAETHRHYHTWDHIEALLRWFYELRDQVVHQEAVSLAIYYHDAIYEVPAATSNEKASALLMLNDLTYDHEPEVLSLAVSLIEATEQHQVSTELEPDEAGDCALFLDMDLSILGAKPDVYQAYAEQIRREYAVFPDALYLPGRAKVLKSFLDRDRLFFSDYFHDQLEERARGNLRNELRRLN